MTLPANWTAGQQFTATAENNVETAVNALTNAQPTYGTLASLPSTGYAGQIYRCTDCDAIFQSNGTTWTRVSFGNSGLNTAIGTVPTTGWTAVNMQAGASFASSLDSMLFTIPNVGASMVLQYQYRTYPTPPFTLTTYLEVAHVQPSNSNWSTGGIVISDGTKLIVFGPQCGTNSTGSSAVGWNVWAAQYSTTSTYGSTYTDWPVTFFTTFPKWYQFKDDGTNRTLQCSTNGTDWTIIAGPEAHNNFLTPTRIGLGGGNFMSSNLLMRCRSWNGVA